MTGRTYCILGGGGAFGINLAQYLLVETSTEKVVGVGRAPLRPEPFSLNIQSRDKYEYVVTHIDFNLDRLLAYLDDERPEVIVNFAAQGEGAASWQNSWMFFATNGTALVRLYEELSKRSYIKRFIQIGSSEVYGSSDKPLDESAPFVPSSPYAASKAAFDMYLLAMIKSGKGVPTTILRPSNAYCPGQLLHRIIPRAIVSALAGKRMPLNGGGVVRKSYIHAQDLSRAIYMVAESQTTVGRVYNVGPLAPTAIRYVAEQCAAVCGKSIDEVFDIAPARPGEDAQYWLDSSAIYRDVGWGAEIGWDDGLFSMYNWVVKYLEQLRDWPTDYKLRA